MMQATGERTLWHRATPKTDLALARGHASARGLHKGRFLRLGGWWGLVILAVRQVVERSVSETRLLLWAVSRERPLLKTQLEGIALSVAALQPFAWRANHPEVHPLRQPLILIGRG